MLSLWHHTERCLDSLELWSTDTPVRCFSSVLHIVSSMDLLQHCTDQDNKRLPLVSAKSLDTDVTAARFWYFSSVFEPPWRNRNPSESHFFESAKGAKGCRVHICYMRCLKLGLFSASLLKDFDFSEAVTRAHNLVTSTRGK